MMRYMGMIRVGNVLTLLSVLSGRCMVLYFNKSLRTIKTSLLIRSPRSVPPLFRCISLHHKI